MIVIFDILDKRLLDMLAILDLIDIIYILVLNVLSNEQNYNTIILINFLGHQGYVNTIRDLD